jgi:hypothetical protein
MYLVIPIVFSFRAHAFFYATCHGMAHKCHVECSMVITEGSVLINMSPFSCFNIEYCLNRCWGWTVYHLHLAFLNINKLVRFGRSIAIPVFSIFVQMIDSYNDYWPTVLLIVENVSSETLLTLFYTLNITGKFQWIFTEINLGYGSDLSFMPSKL